MKRFHIVLSILMLPPMAASGDLNFKMKSIDALCFYNLSRKETSVSLNDCGLKKTKFLVHGHNKNLTQKGFIGFDWKDPKTAIQGYSYYQYFKASPSHYWLFTINNGGGNAEFDSLYWVKAFNKEKLMIKLVMSGNRCNGGIAKLAYEKNHLMLYSNLTAYDLIARSKAFIPSIKAYDDLASCAVCCVAKGVYELKQQGKAELKYLDLGTNCNINEMPTQGRYQACFNALLSSTVAKGKTQLSLRELDEFVRQFNTNCLKF